ncbi:MAG: SUMF1/EgtB/PvdO family nonheme iron enzyme [Deltaproteobacteria bacterium]|nr:SUMF1/EgtB/PvdO family nonheme iron enzyme [Deltaproteobacteria bacterium]MCB9479637.1 SUMF1/EgtB/PvdO family nonheme iron enzyme [Deltaproteobacteria bacterium]MCB9489866.1 SUMF1/EgtB/PvdO family nonheme iron enzyme [Deltaproteobacteria bacterium]
MKPTGQAVLIVALFAAALGVAALLALGPAWRSADPAPDASAAVPAHNPTPCEDDVFKLYAKCGGIVEELSFYDALAQCEQAAEPNLWECVRSCRDTACDAYPACVVRCVDDAEPAARPAPKAPVGMAAVSSGWSVTRFEGERWASRNRHFRLVRVPAFAMDVYEYPNRKGAMPATPTFAEAKAMCAEQGKRLCRLDEWQKVCGQAVGLDYPYGDTKDCDRCNTATCDDPPRPRESAPSGSFARCHGKYGVYDLSGNVSEFLAEPWGPWSDDVAVAGGSYNLNFANSQALLDDGSWKFSTYSDKCSALHNHAPNMTNSPDDGFRCCLGLEDGSDEASKSDNAPAAD